MDNYRKIRIRQVLKRKPLTRACNYKRKEQMKILYHVWHPEKPNIHRQFTKFCEAKKYADKQNIQAYVNKSVSYNKNTTKNYCDTVYGNGKDPQAYYRVIAKLIIE